MPLAARELKKTFHDSRGSHAALRGVSFFVGDREKLVVLGPNGAGKTTLLRAVAGLEQPDVGTIEIDGRDVTHHVPQRRRVAFVFQENALFPHLTIEENLAFGLRARNSRKNDASVRVRDVAESLEIASHLEKRPAALSAGERQRAEFARAILSDPRVLLLDEPLAHVDPQLRAHLRSVIVSSSKDDIVTVYVTHDHADAMNSGGRLAIMFDGEIVQCDEPQRVYDFPANTRVARFFGAPPMNLLADGMETIGIRPEYVRIENGGSLHGTVTAVESAGADAFVGVSTERGNVIVRTAVSQAPHTGAGIELSFPDAFVRRFNGSTGALLQ